MKDFGVSLRVILILTLTTAQMIEEPQPIRVIGSSPPDGTIIKKGYGVRLSCKTSIKWFFCLWKSPDGDKQCAIQESSPRSVCSPDERVVLEGGPNHCDLVLKDVSALEDYGSWMCTVSDAETFESVKHYINLEVAQPAYVEFDPHFGPERVLRITEGEEQTINCRASKSHPTPILSWEELDSIILDTKSEPVISRNERTHTTEVIHSAVYKADLGDDNRVITCVATQLDHDGRTVLYETSASFKLRIDKIVLPLDNALRQKIGIISGVLLSILLILLLIVCLAFLVCRRRRRGRPKSKRPPSSQISIATSAELSPQPALKPIWTVKAGERFHQRDEQLLRNSNAAKKYEIKISPPNGRRPDSRATLSTRGSQEGSWSVAVEEEESRSIGSAQLVNQRPQKTSPPPALSSPPLPRETHFDESMEDDEFAFDFPRASVVLHQPTSSGMGHAYQPQQQSQPFSYLNTWRPSSAATNEPFYHFGYGSHAALTSTRPSSSLSYPNSVADPTKPLELFYYNFPTPRRLASPNGILNTSGVSVFECDLGCFKIPPDGSSTNERDNTIDLNAIITSHPLTETSEEEPRDV